MPKKHFYLITAELAYKIDKDSPDVFRGVTNAVTQLEEPLLNAHFLAKSQQNAQIAFMQHHNTPFHIVDVVLVNVCYLGHMSDEEFKKTPDNLQVATRE